MSQEATKIAPKMSEDDRKALQEQIAEDELILKNPDGLAAADAMTGNREMKDSIRRKKEALGRDEDLIAKGEEKDRIHARIKEIETLIKPHMPTKNEMWKRMGTDESNDAVKKNMYFQSKFAREINELISLKRRLEPQDPLAGSLERIRPN
jgi:hypothetical protein